ncbi:restriction endonuclease subunit S [bacterium]|nr:restriction endonuclease subunit S [bacterium]
MKKYPKYKDSGIEWLGEIPEGWEVKRLKYATENLDNIRVPLSAEERGQVEGSYPYYGATGIIGYVNDYLFDGEYLLIGEDGAPFFLENKDVAFTAKGKFWVNNHAHILKIYENSDIRFVMHSLNCVDYEKYITGSTRDKLTQSDLSRIIIPFPPFSEQQSIANFLDQKTSKIDELIKKNEKLVELLKEKRQAIISHAVTKGLDPNVEMKDSGVEWIGKVPEHWGVSPIKRIVDTPVTDGPHETPEILDEGVPFVSAEAIRDNKINFERKRGFISEYDHRRYSLKYHPKRDDIYMIKSGATTGNLAIVETDEEFNIWSPLAVIRVHQKKVDARFVLSAMNSKEFQTSVQLFWSYGTQQNIGMNVIENLLIPLPPLSEQQFIANFLDQKTAKIDDLTQNIQSQIETLKEYRQSLISNVVTGKIDVRSEHQ